MAAPTDLSAFAPEFDFILDRMAGEVVAGRGACVVFEDGSTEARQQALGRMKDATGLPLHQIGLDTLFDERAQAAQGNLREVFDSMGETPSILCFEHADAFFRKERRQSVQEGLDPDALTPMTYLFDRIKAFNGVIVLCLSSAAYVAEARPFADVVVRFERGHA